MTLQDLPKYVVVTIHDGTDWAILPAPLDEDPEWTMTLEEARATAAQHGRYFDFSSETPTPTDPL